MVRQSVKSQHLYDQLTWITLDAATSAGEKLPRIDLRSPGTNDCTRDVSRISIQLSVITGAAYRKKSGILMTRDEGGTRPAPSTRPFIRETPRSCRDSRFPSARLLSSFPSRTRGGFPVREKARILFRQSNGAPGVSTLKNDRGHRRALQKEAKRASLKRRTLDEGSSTRRQLAFRNFPSSRLIDGTPKALSTEEKRIPRAAIQRRAKRRSQSLSRVSYTKCAYTPS